MKSAAGRWGRRALWLALAWIALNLVAIGASWMVGNLPLGGGPAIEHELDLRSEIGATGRTIELLAKRADPGSGDFVGHFWVRWPEALDAERPGLRAWGYYAEDQTGAAMALAGALAAPWGMITGQAPIPGRIRADDGLSPTIVIRVRVDESAYIRALQVDARWRQETRYVLRPGIRGLGPGRTYACQDYALEVAEALGLRRGASGWWNFPMSQARALANANGIALR